jgi:hypothetical protein
MWCESALEAVEGADVTVIVTEWNELRALDLDRVRAAMRGDVLVDLRNIYGSTQVRAAELVYMGIGRPKQPLSVIKATKARPPVSAKSRLSRQKTHPDVLSEQR